MELNNRKSILHKYLENPTLSGSSISKILSLPKTTVCSVIKRYKEGLGVERATQNNRRSGNTDKKLRGQVLRSIKANPGISDYDRSKKRSTVRRIRIREGYKSYRAIKTPNRNDKQNLTAKKRARLLYDRVLTKFNGCILMDDETYVKMDFKQLPGQKCYLARNRGDVPAKYKYVQLDKFGKKLMIWQAICSCGLKSKVFITSSTMTSSVYVKECLQKRILPLIRQHRSAVKFWPDLASCHYSKETMNWYEANKVDVIPKELNPPNCPQFRPIEKYWAIMKSKLKKMVDAC